MNNFKRRHHLFSIEAKVGLKYFPSWQDSHSNLDIDLVKGNNLLISEMHDLTENSAKEVMMTQR